MIDPHATSLPSGAGPGPADLPDEPFGGSGRYRLVAEIARGGMGVIYRATDTVLGRDVAVKVLHQKFSPESSAARRFAGEAVITAQLQHPAIPPVHELGTLPDGRPFLAMKLIKGQTLDQRLRDRNDPAANRGPLLAAFEQVCQALAYAHAHGVVHRDLKPSNIMVGAFGEVQVMDWGLAKVLGARVEPVAEEPEATAAGTQVRSLRDTDQEFTQAGIVLGTPAYMPPEQAIGAVELVDARSDVFGLGALLAVILTGRPPFTGDSSEAIRQAAARGKIEKCFTRLNECGAEPELVALCKRCLAPEASDRPADGGDVASAVAGLRQAAEERARQAELERIRAELRAAEQRKRRRIETALAVAVALLLLGAGAVAWWEDRQAAERRSEARQRQQAEQERLDRNAAALAVLLEQAEQSLRARDASKADVALGTAGERLAEGAEERLAGQLSRLRADLAVLRELDAIDSFRWTFADNKFPDARAIAPRLQRALDSFGAHPGRVPPQEVAARVRASAVRDRLIAALDWLLRGQPKNEVHAALRAADPDPYRDAVRDAMLAGDEAAEQKLADRPEAAQQPAEFVALLASNTALPLVRRRQLLGEAIRRRPGELGLLMAMGLTYRDDRPASREAALRWYQAAVAVAPSNPAAHSNLGSALHDRGDLDSALAEFREALRLDRTIEPAQNGLSIVLRLRGDLDGALAAAKEAQRLDPKSVYSLNSLGQVLWKKGDLDGAEQAFQEAIRIDPRHAYIHNNLRLLRKARGDLDGALAACRQAVQAIPKSAAARINLAHALLDKKNYGAAVAEYNEAVRLDRTDAEAYTGLGIALRAQGDLAGSLQALATAVRLDPTDATARNSLGLTRWRQKDLNGARADFEEAIRLDRRFAGAHSNLAGVLRDLGEVDEAVAAFRAATRFNPKDAETHSRLATALTAAGDHVGALAAIEEAVRLAPQEAVFHNNLGNARKRRDDLSGAVAAYRESLRLDPAVALTHHNFAQVLRQMGDFAAALAEHREAVRLEPTSPSARRELARTEAMARVLPRLADAQAGRDEPSAADCCALADLCAQPFRKEYAAAAQWYARAFAGDPRLAEDLERGHRHDAARCAVRAARGVGAGVPSEAAERSGLRAQALLWLRADLAAYTGQVASGSLGRRKEALEHLERWLREADFAELRPGPARANLTDDERAAWDAFCEDVKAVLLAARSAKNPG